MKTHHQVIVVGAGVSGLIAAGRAAERGAKVLLLEKMERAGRKLLITGKGRCNITNDAPMSEFLSHVKPNSRFMKPAFSTFFSSHIIELLNRYGVETVVERGGRVFPTSNLAADVLQALLTWVKQQGVEIHYHCKVQKLLVRDSIIEGVEVLENGRLVTYNADRVIVCTGGKSYPATGSDGDGYRMASETGHVIETVRPSLVPIETHGTLAQELQGLSLKNVSASVWVNGKKQASDFGEMLFTHFGLSGPIILTLSRLVVDELMKKSKVEISIDLKPALDEQKLDARLIRDLNENGKKHIDNVFKLWLPSKLIPVFIKTLGIDPYKECHQMGAKERKKIALMMKDLRLEVKNFRSFKEAIITAGGVSTQDVNPKTMESRKVKNLYFAGEVLDVDADTGGFNLQIAYSTAWLAAESCTQTTNDDLEVK